MRFSWFALLFVTLALAASGARAQLTSPEFPVEVRAATETVAAGGTLRVEIEIDVEHPWHIQGPESELYPTRLAFETPPGITLQRFDFPEPEWKSFAELAPMDVYEHQVVIGAEFAVAPDAPAGPARLLGSIAYQACDDQGICLFPNTMALPVLELEIGADGGVTVTGTGPAELPERPQEPAVDEPAAGSAPVSGGAPLTGAGGALDIEGVFRDSGLFLGLGLIFLGGLALNLTPCVFPIIPITIGFFAQQADKNRRKTLALAGCYVLGMVLMYSILAVVAASMGALFGSFAANKWLFVGVAVVIVALALSNFGLYELRPPQFIMSKGGSKSGYLGALGMGFMIGVVAAPCSGPVVLGLMAFVTGLTAQGAVGTAGSYALSMGLFGTLALGLGVPYLVLGYYSGLLGALPRSGAWMEVVKRVLGVVMIFAALFFLQYGAVLPPGLLGALMAGFWLAAGVYLVFGDSELRSAVKAYRFKLAAGLLALAWGGFSVVAVGQQVDRLDAEAREYAGIIQDIAQDGGNVDVANLNIRAVWPDATPERLAQAAEAGVPVVVDFTAEWCAACKELEHHTFPQPEVREELRRFRYYKVDLTLPERQWTDAQKALVERFGVQGLPVVAFLGPDGEELRSLRLVEFERADRFAERLRRVPGPPVIASGAG